MECFCWIKTVVKLITSHKDTGEPQDNESIDKLVEILKFQAGDTLLRRTELSLLDIRFHKAIAKNSTLDVQKIAEQTWDENIHFLPFNSNSRMQKTFLHIFG